MKKGPAAKSCAKRRTRAAARNEITAKRLRMCDLPGIKMGAGRVNTVVLSPEAKALYYVPDRNAMRAVIAVGDCPFDLKVHPVTVSKPNGVTPRHLANQELVEALNPPLVTPRLGETVHVKLSLIHI